MKIKDIKYSPILKTTIAEMKGYENLNQEIKEKILPVFELTKGRKSKNDRIGDISKQISKIFDISGGNKFVLDLTLDKALSNPQIDRMLNSYSNGYPAWCAFVKEIYQENLIPVIHFNEEASSQDNNAQLEKLRNISDILAFRLDPRDISVLEFLEKKSQREKYSIIFILDMGYVFNSTVSQAIIDNINEIIEKHNPLKIFISSSSFPKSATEAGSEEEGGADLFEVQIFASISKKINSKKIAYGDYACIHPERIQQAGARGWYPRIDYPLDDFWFYQRERSKGDYTTGYSAAANKVILHEKYSPIKDYDCWGEQEVLSAAEGIPNGRNPAHWIAVRANIHITRQCCRLY